LRMNSLARQNVALHLNRLNWAEGQAGKGAGE
jgi:hypothetical protein